MKAYSEAERYGSQILTSGGKQTVPHVHNYNSYGWRISMYKEFNVADLSTGQLAVAYQKMDKAMGKVAGGCWELAKNNYKSANAHRLQIKSVRLADGGRDIEAVRLIDLVRQRYGYETNPEWSYAHTCHNVRCFNPAHHVIKYTPLRSQSSAVHEESVEFCKQLRQHGWNTEYQKLTTTATAYMQMEKHSCNIEADKDIARKIDLDVLVKFASLLKDPRVLPRFEVLVIELGLLKDELLPYGHAISSIIMNARHNGIHFVKQTLELMAAGKTNHVIAQLTNRTTRQVQAFRGSLYGG